MADLATAFVGASAGVSCVSRSHGKFGGGAHRYVSGLPSVSWQIWRRRSSGRQRAFPAFHGTSLQRFHCVSLGRHFSGFIAFHWGVTSAVSLRISRRLRNTSSRLWDGESTALALHKTFSRAISATFSDRPHHFVTVSGRSSREHCVRDARGGACPCHVGSFPFHGLRSVY